MNITINNIFMFFPHHTFCLLIKKQFPLSNDYSFCLFVPEPTNSHLVPWTHGTKKEWYTAFDSKFGAN